MKSKNIKHYKRIISFIAETGMLMQMPRSHKQQLGNTFDTVSSHSHHSSIIAYSLTRLEGLSHDDGLRSMAMGTLHDLPEARTGDLNFVEKHYATTNEEKAWKDQLTELPFSEDLHNIIQEYEIKETLVSKCAKDADGLEQMYQEWLLMHTGNKMAEKWFKIDFKYRVPKFHTQSAKKIAIEMKKSHPHQWWFEDLVDKNFNSKLLNGKK